MPRRPSASHDDDAPRWLKSASASLLPHHHDGPRPWRRRPGEDIMKTYCIRHEVVITASPQATYLALTDIARLARWWTSDTRGDGASIGGVLEFRFGDFCQKFTVMALQAGEQVRWKA